MASKPIDPSSPRRIPTEGLNTDRYYAAHTRTVINRRGFSERRGRPSSPLPAPRPPMVFPDKSTNSNKYYQENFGQNVRPIGTPIQRPQPVATEPAPVTPPPTQPDPDVKPPSNETPADTPVKYGDDKAKNKPKPPKPTGKAPEKEKTPERPKPATFSLRSGEQLPPVIKNVIERLQKGETVTIEAKSKTLLGDFDQLLLPAAVEANFPDGPISRLVRKLAGKTQPELILEPPAAPLDDDGFGDLDADDMQAVIEADDPEAVLQRIDNEKAAGSNEGSAVDEDEPDGFGDDENA